MQGSFKKALDAINANRLGDAHRYLLQVLTKDPENIHLWLLLGWTAPNSDTAAYYFQHLLKRFPDNPLAREFSPLVVHRPGRYTWDAGFSLTEKKQIIIKIIAYFEKSLKEKELDLQQSKAIQRRASEEVEFVCPMSVAEGSLPSFGQQTTKRARHFTLPKNFKAPLVYLAALAIAEGVTALANPLVGLGLHGIILVALILHATLIAQRGEQKFLITLTLAPLIRLMSLSVPLLSFPAIYWYAVIGAPLFMAVYLICRMTGFDAGQIGLNLRSLPWQILVGVTGLGLGYVEYVILKPTPLVAALNWQQILIPSLILLVFTGLLEEVIFRGIIQRGAAGTLGRYALLYVSMLFAILHIGYRSVLDFLFVLIVALFFGVVVARTGSLLGVTLSHGLTNVALYLVIPFLVNGAAQPIGHAPVPISNYQSPKVVWASSDIRWIANSNIEIHSGSTVINEQKPFDINPQLDACEGKLNSNSRWIGGISPATSSTDLHIWLISVRDTGTG